MAPFSSEWCLSIGCIKKEQDTFAEITLRRERWAILFEWLKSQPEKSGTQIRDLFTELDADGSGAVDVKEFLSGLKAKGIPGLTNGRLMSLHGDCDINGDNLITLEEFTDMFAQMALKIRPDTLL